MKQTDRWTELGWSWDLMFFCLLILSSRCSPLLSFRNGSFGKLASFCHIRWNDQPLTRPSVCPRPSSHDFKSLQSLMLLKNNSGIFVICVNKPVCPPEVGVLTVNRWNCTNILSISLSSGHRQWRRTLHSWDTFTEMTVVLMWPQTGQHWPIRLWNHSHEAWSRMGTMAALAPPTWITFQTWAG